MKLFDIQADKVIIHNDTLGIPCFRKLWESEIDKSKATDYISYIVFKNKHDSPYVKAFSLEDRETHLKEQLFGDPAFELPELVILCEEEYIRLTETLFVGLLKNVRNRLESISQYHRKALGDELDDDRIKVIIAGIEKLGATAKSLEQLEENARKEESLLTSKVRGGAEISAFEIPDKR